MMLGHGEGYVNGRACSLVVAMHADGPLGCRTRLLQGPGSFSNRDEFSQAHGLAERRLVSLESNSTSGASRNSKPSPSSTRVALRSNR